MKEISLTISNQESAALKRVLPEILKHRLIPRMAGEKPDKGDSATPAYRVLAELLKKLEAG